MKHTERWLIVSIIAIGVVLLLLGGKQFIDYSRQVHQANADISQNAQESSYENQQNSENSTLDSGVAEAPYAKLSKQIRGVEINAMEESLFCCGYKVEITECKITKEYDEQWMMDESAIDWSVQQYDSSYNILSDEQYIVVHMKITPYENYGSLVVEDAASELTLNNNILHFFDENQEYITTIEPCGITNSDGQGKQLFSVMMNFGETKEADLIFIDSECVLANKENPILVFEFNPCGVVNTPEIRKGMVLNVEN